MSREVNETELMVKLERQLRQALPMLPPQVKLERNLRLKLGHKQIYIDGLYPSTQYRGRYDLLILNEGNPLLLAEFKAPDVEITDDDVAQGLSYARAHVPIVPLLLVTNGKASRLIRTYDGLDVAAGISTFQELKSRVETASKIAERDVQDAVSTLLGTRDESWASIFSSWNREALEGLTGKLVDVQSPLVENFSIPRNITKQVIEGIRTEERVIILHGSPLSGITNVLSQIVKTFTERPLLFFPEASNVDCFQFIANRLSREFGYPVQKEQVRGWINSVGMISKTVFVFDGVPKQDVLDELREMASAGNLLLVLGVDTEKFKQLELRSGRNEKSALGKVATNYKLSKLSDDEFEQMEQMLLKLGAFFQKGAGLSHELRRPKNLRFMLSTLPISDEVSVGSELIQAVAIPPIPDIQFLTDCGRVFDYSPELKHDLSLLSKAFVEEALANLKDNEWLVSTYGMPSLNPDDAESKLGTDRINRLREIGLISWIETSIGSRLLIRSEEMLALYTSKLWAEKLSTSNESLINGLLFELFDLAHRIPLGFIALASAIEQAGPRNAELYSHILQLLYRDMPRLEQVKNGQKLALLSKERKIEIELKGGEWDPMLANLASWLTLSHIVARSISIQGQNRTYNFSVFEMLCSFPNVLFSPPHARLEEIKPIHTHTIPQVGSLVCPQNGMVEPVVQSLYFYACNEREEFKELAAKAIKDANVPLAMRIYIVCNCLENVSDDKFQKDIHRIQNRLNIVLSKAFESIATEHS